MEEQRVDPVHNDGQREGEMFVGYKCEDWSARFERSCCLVRVEWIHVDKRKARLLHGEKKRIGFE